jgi:hypothetical protein
MSREEDELLGAVAVRSPVYVEDNGATVDIVDVEDPSGSVEVDENPHIVSVVDSDGYPGFRPAVEAAKTFEQEAGLEDLADAEDERDDTILGDDLEHRMHQQQEAEDEVGSSGSDLAAMHLVDQVRKKEEAQRSPYINTNPSSVYSAIMGGSATVDVPNAPPGSAETPVLRQVALWAGEDTETRMVTVVFAPLQPIMTPAAGGRALRPFGRVFFGTRSFSYNFDVDIARGVQLAISASQVSLQVGCDPAFGPTPTSMILGGTLSFGVPMHTTPITRTAYFDPQTGTTVKTVVPLFARSAILYMTSATSTISLAFINSNGVIIYSFTTTAGVLMDPILLSNDVAFIDTTRVAGPDTESRLIFELGV